MAQIRLVAHGEFRSGPPREQFRRCGVLSLVTVLSLLIVAAAGRPAHAAAPTGRIEGTITDRGGDPIANAVVSVKGPVTKSVRTRAAGSYSFAVLPVGTYRLEVKRLGFESAVREGVVVVAGAPVRINFSLSLGLEEHVVVTASRAETSSQDAPASVTAITEHQIANAPATNIGDILRSVPGLNVVQTSAREIEIASRQASPTLTNSQLALIDGRTIYSDFFDLVFWDFVPINTSDIKQIEVVRGPAAAVWGANAATGVVNIITKAPREDQGLTVTLDGGGFARDPASTQGAGGRFWSANLSYSKVYDSRWSFRLSGGYTMSDPYARPTGVIPLSTSPVDPTVVGGGSYGDAAFANQGTRQPKFDARVDEDLEGGGRITYETGVGGSQGIIHTPIGPFRMESGARLGYGRISYDNAGLRLSCFANLLRGQAPNLLTRAADGSELVIDFHTDTYDLNAGYSRLVGKRNLISVGANLRKNKFDISIAPAARNRTEEGIYLEDEILLGRVHAPLAVRVDRASNLDRLLVAPRAALVYQLTNNHSFRISYNRAYRTPSAIDNDLDVSFIGGLFPLGLVDPAYNGQFLPLVERTIGNRDLRAETLDAWEVGYTGKLGKRLQLEAAVYRNDSNHIISNQGYSAALAQNGVMPVYTSSNPPPGWPFPPQVLDQLAAAGIFLPFETKTLNLGKVRNHGFELGAHYLFDASLTGEINYSYQGYPESLAALDDPYRFPTTSLSTPPTNRWNARLAYDDAVLYGDLSASLVSRAFWADVLGPQYYGYTDSYDMINLTLGRRWAGGRFTTSIRAVNVLDQKIQQHIFGDVLTRRIYLEAQYRY